MIWFLFTEVFKFGLGLMRGVSLGEMLHADDFTAGQVWIFIAPWVLIGPVFVHWFVQRMPWVR